MKPKNPIQPLATDDHGTLRFKANVLVKALLDQPRGLDLNALTERFHRDEHADDWRQLANSATSTMRATTPPWRCTSAV